MTYWRVFLWLSASAWSLAVIAGLYFDIRPDRQIQAAIMAAVFTVGTILAEMIAAGHRK